MAGVQCSAEAIIGSIDAALGELDRHPLPLKLANKGWTDEAQEDMIRLLRDWKEEIQGAGELRRSHFRVIARFFGDLGIDTNGGLAENIVRMDNQIYDCTSEPEAIEPTKAPRKRKNSKKYRHK